MSYSVVISGTGLWTPEQTITNDELVESFNEYVKRFNARNAEAIEAGEVDALGPSDSAFIEKASGIKQRFVIDKSGILDPDRMAPRIAERSDDEVSIQAEIAVKAARQALEHANLTADDLDAVLVACSNMQRPYPAMAVEVQAALGMKHGWGYDMNVACSSATFGIQAGVDAIRNGSARRVLMVNPEICSGHLAWEDRDCHFIFGDVATAVILERKEDATSGNQWEILGTRLQTKFSNNIRSNFGYMTRAEDVDPYGPDKLFHQAGRKVFKEVCPMAAAHIEAHLASHDLTPEGVKRWWLHQANINMNTLICKRLLGRDADRTEAPIVLDEYANTASAGSVIAFGLNHEDLVSGDVGVLCSFGAGYSIGSLVIRKR